MIGSIMDPFLKPIRDQIKQAAGDVMDAINTSVLSGVDKIINNIRKKLAASIYSILFFGAGAVILLIGAGQLIDFYTKINGAGFVLAGFCLIILGIYYKSRIKEK